VFFLLLGLIIALGICWGRQYQTDKQIREILNSLSQYEQILSLPTIAQVRRNVNLLSKDYQALQSELQIYQSLLDIAPIGYLKIDEQNHLIECNQEAKELLSIQRWQKGRLRLFLELVRSYELDQLIQQTRKIKQNLMIEWQFFPSDDYALDEDKPQEQKRLVPIFLQANSISLPQEEVAIFLVNKQLLHELIKRRDEAYADLSHELRTPLTSISLLAETLIEETQGQAQVWTKQIYQEINRLINLVQNWLNLTKLEQNPYENLQLQNLDLKQLILSAWNSIATIANQENITLQYQGLNNVIIEADLNYLTQVFINLFDNSIKHSPANSLILIQVKYHEQQDKQLVEINLIDSGNGFQPEDLPYIFERLYRGEKSRVRKTKEGSGLGLSIVKKIVEAHKGSITAQNHPETGGAWFQIIIPTIS
jgi:two-component system phosphate regulon sensor histidine kinase PhoR